MCATGWPCHRPAYTHHLYTMTTRAARATGWPQRIQQRSGASPRRAAAPPNCTAIFGRGQKAHHVCVTSCPQFWSNGLTSCPDLGTATGHDTVLYVLLRCWHPSANAPRGPAYCGGPRHGTCRPSPHGRYRHTLKPLRCVATGWPPHTATPTLPWHGCPRLRRPRSPSPAERCRPTAAAEWPIFPCVPN